MLLDNVIIFAASESKIHVSLKAEKVFEIGSLNVTNSMVYGVLIALVLGLSLTSVANRSSINAKKGLITILELIIEFVISTLESAFGSREKAIKYTPVFATYFLFILCTNILGLLPLVGPGINVNGTPLFRPFTADINGTIVMAVVAIISVQVMSIQAQGVKGHLTHYFSNKPLNPINFFIGVLEVLGEFTRILSLSLRLFLNTAVGEILVAVFTSLILQGGRTPLAALPIFLFEILVAGIQAYVFTVLSATYLSLAINHAHDEEDHGLKAHKVEELSA